MQHCRGVGKEGGRGERHGHHGHLVRAVPVAAVDGDGVSAIGGQPGSSLFTKGSSISYNGRRQREPHRLLYLLKKASASANHGLASRVKFKLKKVQTVQHTDSGRGRRGIILESCPAMALP